LSITKIEKMTDEECLEMFLHFLETRINITTHFAQLDEKDENITHQIMEVSCGDYVSTSQPEPLSVVLRMATGAEQGATIN
jgi:hypothetical protein